MRVWRICKGKDVATTMSGAGSSYASGRSHLKGSPVVYTSSTASLAALETLVHFDPALAPPDLRLLEIDVPDTLSLESFDPAGLPHDWRAYPGPVALQMFGSTWLRELRSVVLRVPSAVLPVAVEANYLLNPLHPEAEDLSIVEERPFTFDSRLLPVA
jgi:RES domain-containing protein